MNGETGSPGEDPRDDVVAGEYVLGVLSLDARRAVEARMQGDAAFAARVARWQSDLSVLDVHYAAVEPPASVLREVEARLFPAPAGAAGGATAVGSGRGAWSSLAFWRLATLVCLVAIAGLLAALGGVFAPTDGASPLVAELSAKDSPMSLVAFYDRAGGTVRLAPVAAGGAARHALELWMINGKSAPVSLGVLPEDGQGSLTVPEADRDALSSGTVLAISLEPAGGSPTGAPTGPVVAAGPARAL